MSEIVLVHGSCFGGWVWDGLAVLLRGKGHQVSAIDLPGRHGTPTSLRSQSAAITASISGRAVLIGHSAGGYPITMAAETAPERVAGLIYLAAYVPRSGASVADLRRAGPAQPMRGTFRVRADRAAYAFDPVAADRLFFHDCDGPDVLCENMCAEPVAPQETAFGTLAFSPHLPRAAIITTADRAIPPDWQRAMAAGMATHDLASGHCPQLSTPVVLAALIGAILTDWTERTP